MTNQKRMLLGSFFQTFLGHHLAAWRYPETKTEEVTSLSLYKEIAELSEKGKFDIIFLADVLAHNEEDIAYTPQIRLEATTMMASLASITKNIGLVATLSTTFTHPFNVARQFATIDHMSGGRAAWNIVTTAHDHEAANFGLEEQLDHSIRYERADEFVEVTKKLWDSWEKDTLLFDRENGIFLDEKKIHPIYHEGKYFKVRGPINIPRPPQGYPLLVTASASDKGREFAVKHADILFTLAPSTVEEGKAVYRTIKQKVAAYGRNPEHFKIMPGIVPFVGKTEKEAIEKFEHFQELILPQLGIGWLSRYVDHDLSQYSPDDPMPELKEVDQVNGEKGRFKLLSDLARERNYTIKELARYFVATQGHLFVVGSGEQVADTLSDWYLNGAADGFNIKFPYFPGGIKDFVDYAIPVLQERGLVQTEYADGTLREKLGLDYPSLSTVNV
ncbi:LLM class flavin-dependent oxidoreductase [Ureibacillus sp. FSL K6-3587]|jgi:FMN-dependent oxidoreductase (nitrilotriacetate monooxygenase family)|uniref:LLM class flavin-dependent oxidoreductase n=1 Tax=unclassified Ureibacillus TaxID=2638520 RepID=UPI00315904F1